MGEVGPRGHGWKLLATRVRGLTGACQSPKKGWADAVSPPVEVVAGEDGVHGREVDGVRLAYLNGVLDEGVEADHEIFEALDVLDVLDERVHGSLTLGELHLTVFVPEGFPSHAGVRFLDFRPLALEEFLGQFGEGVAGKAVVLDDDELLHEFGEVELGDHYHKKIIVALFSHF